MLITPQCLVSNTANTGRIINKEGNCVNDLHSILRKYRTAGYNDTQITVREASKAKDKSSCRMEDNADKSVAWQSSCWEEVHSLEYPLKQKQLYAME